MSSDWDIKKRSEVCTATGDLFEDGQVIISRLVFGEEGYAREDYSVEKWNDDLVKDALSIWKTRVVFPPPPKEESFKKENAESLLRQFMAKEDFTQNEAIYILGLMLERKKILVEKDVQRREDGVKIRIYEHRKTGEMFMIPDPELKLSELESIQEEVVIMLGGKPRGDAEESEASENSSDEEAAPAEEKQPQS